MKHADAASRVASIIETLRAERERQGISLRRLGMLAGMDRTAIGRIEQGERSPTLLNCLRLADALGLDLADVLKQTDQKKRKSKQA